MPTFLQKLQLAWRGWNRRRAEKEEEFLRRSTAWGPTTTPVSAQPTTAAPTTRAISIDYEGLQVAYLDDSGKIAHYLDVESGEVIEFGASESRPEITGNPKRYRRVPTRSEQSEGDDRRAFVAQLEPSKTRDRLTAAMGDATAFRRALSEDRTAERTWYSFKNDRALAAVRAWVTGGQTSGGGR